MLYNLIPSFYTTSFENYFPSSTFVRPPNLEPAEGMAKITVCVLAGSSRVGQACIETLVEKFGQTVHVRAAIRSPEKASLLQRFEHIEIVVGVDAFEPGSHERAFTGVQKVFIVAPQIANRDKAVNCFLDSAKKWGVSHVVFIGGVFQEEELFLFHRQWMSSRKHAESLQLNWTQLECSDFMENIYRSQKSIQEEDLIYGAGAQGVSAPVALSDVGAAAAAVLADQSSKHENRAYRITGAEPFTPVQVAAMFSRLLRRPIQFVDAGIAEARKAAISAGVLPRWQAEGFYDWLEIYFMSGRLASVKSDLPCLDVKPCTYEDWLIHRLQDFM